MSWRQLLPKLKDADDSLLEELRLRFVDEYFSSKIEEAKEWIKKLREAEKQAVEAIKAKGVLWTRELRSFLSDPRRHLAKKLYIYALDLQRGKMKPEEFEKTSIAAARTSINTNMRSIYQSWVFLSIVAILGRRYGAKIVFPEHNHILLERSGRQRGGDIPPNLVLLLPGRGYLSFFVEAPRPVGWGDNRDLSQAWRLYVALRPDMMVYSGRVLNIIRLDSNPPILRPRVILECKELPDWFIRVREIRGPFARPMSGMEWRNRWLRGLWAGLADVLGLSTAEEAYEVVRERRGLRLSEPQIVRLYANIYKPDKLYLISRAPLPSHVKRELENDKRLVVVDNVGFDTKKLEVVAEELADIADYGDAGEPVELDKNTLSKLNILAKSLGVPDRVKLISLLVDYALARLDEVKKFAEKVMGGAAERA